MVRGKEGIQRASSTRSIFDGGVKRSASICFCSSSFVYSEVECIRSHKKHREKERNRKGLSKWTRSRKEEGKTTASKPRRRVVD